MACPKYLFYVPHPQNWYFPKHNKAEKIFARANEQRISQEGRGKEPQTIEIIKSIFERLYRCNGDIGEKKETKGAHPICYRRRKDSESMEQDKYLYREFENELSLMLE